MKGTIQICTICQERKGTEVLRNMCSSGGPRSRRKQSPPPRGKKQQDETFHADGTVAGAFTCSPEGGGAGRRGRCGAGALRSLRINRVLVSRLILAVGYGSDGRRAPRGWTVNEIPSTPGRCQRRPAPPTGEPGARELASEAGKRASPSLQRLW